VSTGITVDLRSAIPPYEQIRSQISSLIALGALAPGTRLPTVRSLAADLGIATGTVARAYKELEAAGLVDSRRRGGTVVTAPAAGPPGSRGAVPVPAAVQAAVDHYIAAGRAAHLGDEVLLDVLRGKLGRDASS
jgi:GntR family transcriptional regulator